MMTQQARILHPDRFLSQLSLRNYASDSPEARARLIILALLVDGEVDEYELMTLNQPEVLDTLGIDREAFVRVLHEVCEDIVGLSREGDRIVIGKSQLSRLFSEVNDPAVQHKMLRLISALIQSDGQISSEEMRYWRTAVRAWKSTGPNSRS